MGHLTQHSVAGGMTSQIVDGLEMVHVHEGHDERLVSSSRPGNVTGELRDPGAPQVCAGERVRRRNLSVACRRAAIGECGVAVEPGLTTFGGARSPIRKGGVAVMLGLTAFAGTGSSVGKGSVTVMSGLATFTSTGCAISECTVAVKLGLTTFVGRGAAIVWRTHPVWRCVSSGLCRSMKRLCQDLGRGWGFVAFRGAVAPLRCLIALVRSTVAQIGGTVSLVRGLIALIRGTVSFVACIVAFGASLVSFVSGTISQVASLVSFGAGLVALGPSLIPFTPGLVPFVACLIAGGPCLVTRVGIGVAALSVLGSAGVGTDRCWRQRIRWVWLSSQPVRDYRLEFLDVCAPGLAVVQRRMKQAQHS
jgi:hypothetical protein